MISIITAIYNQKPVNQLFWENLLKYTKNKFELIIIDNASTDGSGDFFESVGATVIRNSANYSYPHSQNQGIALAKYDWLAFLNNDIIVSPDWDQRLMDNMLHNNLEVASVCGIEQVENFIATRTLKRKWKRSKNFLSIFGNNKTTLQLMHKFMYWDWVDFCNSRYEEFKFQIKDGFVGNTVMMRRSAIAKIGTWDETLQQGDFDLYLRCKQRELEYGDIRSMHICLDVFIHHYIRLTIKAGYPPFADRANLVSLESKWSEKYLDYLKLMNK